MNLKSARGVIEAARTRGFVLLINPGPPPMPVLRKPANVKESEATPALLDALRAWRVEIMDELKAEGVEWSPPNQSGRPPVNVDELFPFSPDEGKEEAAG